jgi:hypothetical protein
VATDVLADWRLTPKIRVADDIRLLLDPSGPQLRHRCLLPLSWLQHREEGDLVTSRQLVRGSGLASILGGVSLAGFVIEHPWDSFVGAEVARTTAWRIAHTLHFVGAALMLIGLIGLYVRQRQRVGALGLIGFVGAFTGTAMFVGTGMITAFVFPMIAVQAPTALEPDGAMFSPPALTVFSLTAVTVTFGYILFGITMFRAHVFPRAATVLFVVGAVMGMIPPQPLGVMPWAGLVSGGILYGAGAVWLGSRLWSDVSHALASPTEDQVAA